MQASGLAGQNVIFVRWSPTRSNPVPPMLEGSGLRTIKDMRLEDVRALSEPADWSRALERGDVVFCRKTGHWIPDLIAALDGYWSHSAVFVGDEQVAHSHSTGVQAWSLDRLVTYYDGGVAFGRPHVSEHSREQAASWADRQVASARAGQATPFGMHDIGLACALLARARVRGALDVLPQVSDAELRDVEREARRVARQRARVDRQWQSTCAGFVYRAYSEGARVPLRIRPAPGVKVHDGRLSWPEGSGLLEALIEVRPGEPIVGELESAILPRVRSLATYVRQAAQVIVGLLEFVNPLASVAIDRAVTPGDLWCSPAMQGRTFLTERSREHALAVLAGSGGAS